VDDIRKGFAQYKVVKMASRKDELKSRCTLRCCTIPSEKHYSKISDLHPRPLHHLRSFWSQCHLRLTLDPRSYLPSLGGPTMSPSPPPQQVTDKSHAPAPAPAAPFQTLTTFAKDPSSTGMARWLATKSRDESWSPFKLTNLHSDHPTAFNSTATTTTTYGNASRNVDGAGSRSESQTTALAQTQKKE